MKDKEVQRIADDAELQSLKGKLNRGEKLQEWDEKLLAQIQAKEVLEQREGEIKVEDVLKRIRDIVREMQKRMTEKEVSKFKFMGSFTWEDSVGKLLKQEIEEDVPGEIIRKLDKGLTRKWKLVDFTLYGDIPF